MKGWAWGMWAACLLLILVMRLFDAHAQLIVQTSPTKTVYTLTWGGKMEVS